MEKYYFKFSDVAPAAQYNVDNILDMVQGLAGADSATEDGFNHFCALSSLEGIYFATSTNDDYVDSDACQARLKAFAYAFYATSRKYAPILNAFEAEKEDLLRKLSSETNGSSTAKGNAVTTGRSSGTHKGSESPKITTTSTTSTEGSDTDITEAYTNDTPQSSGSFVDVNYATTASKNKVTHTPGVKTSVSNAENGIRNTTGEESRTDSSNTNSQSEGTNKATTTYDSGTPAQRLQEIFNAAQNIVDLWMHDLSAFIIVNVD